MAKQGEPKEFKPYIGPEQNIPETTFRAIILGSLLAIVFGVANAYLGLKVGMTVSASIPSAVISMAILRGVLRKGTVLENNIVQTIGSSGESLAAGIIFTIPAFYIWSQTLPNFTFRITNWQIFAFSMLGGIMGILFMIPLRKYLVEKEHNNLRYPEGTACAEILIAGDEGGGKAKTVFAAIGIGALYKFLMSGTKLWSESPTYNLNWYKGGYLGIDATPALLGVGYIIGPRIAALMLAGAVLGYLGIGPLIAYLGAHFPQIIPPANIPISQMTPADLRNFYIKYLGVGAVALGGFISLIKSLPMIINSFSEGAQQIFSKKGRETSKTIPRTKRDLPISLVIFGSLAIVFLLWLFSGREIHIVGVFLAVIFGFFFVTVAARIVGIVGSSSSPVSGMTIATLLVTCLILLSFGLGGYRGMVAAMIVGTVVCIAVCMSGDISQDLKTGFLLGSTPYKQQWTEFVGLLFPAFFMGITVALLNKSYGFVGPGALLAPQANVMAALVQGVMNQNLPWIPIIVGAMLALSIELLGIGSLPFAIGLYLPLNLSTPIMAGAIIYTIVDKISPKDTVDKRTEKGILFGSGLVAGDALVGVIIAGLIAIPSIRIIYEKYEEGFLFGTASGWVSLIAFLILCGVFYLFTKVKPGRENGQAFASSKSRS